MQAGIATLTETLAMSAQELIEINAIAEQLLQQNANRIANSIGIVFGGSDKNDKKGG